MKVQNIYQIMLLAMTFFLGILLTLIPLPYFLEWFRPHWLLLILIFWMKTLPRSIGFLVAWTIGFWLDSIEGGIIGQYPLIFLLIALLVALTRNRSLHFSYVQQLFWIAGLVGLSQLLSLLMAGFTHGRMLPIFSLSSVLTSTLVWPLVAGGLQTCYRLGWNTRLPSTHY